MTPIRILRVYHSGVVHEYRKRELLLRSTYGYDVHLVAPAAWSEGGSTVSLTPDPQVPVHQVAVRGRRHPILFWYATNQLREIVRRLQPQIVDLHEEPYSLAVAAALSLIRREAPKARICVYSAQNIYKRYPTPFRQLEARALRHADAAYPCSEGAAEVLTRKGFRGNMHILPLGVSIPPTRAPAVRRPLQIGMFGRLEPYKGAHVALRAFATVAGQVDATLELVGAGSQERLLRELARELGLRDRVNFAGPVSQEEALRRIAEFDVILVPSLTTRAWKEQFGRVAAQAMAAGTSVIASDSGALPEVLGGCGELVPEGSVSDLATALQSLLHDDARRARLGALSRRRAQTHLSWERVAAGCDDMYAQLLGATNPSRIISGLPASCGPFAPR